MQPETPDDGAPDGRLTLSGDVSLHAIDAIHARLLAMAGEPAVVIDCSGVTHADLSIVQLILAAELSARRSGRSVALAQPATGAMLEVLQRGGFLTAGDDRTAANHGFWLQTTDLQ